MKEIPGPEGDFYAGLIVALVLGAVILAIVGIVAARFHLERMKLAAFLGTHREGRRP